MFTRGMFWLLLLLVPTVSLIIDYVVIYTKLIFKPSPVDIAIEYDRYPLFPLPSPLFFIHDGGAHAPNI